MNNIYALTLCDIEKIEKLFIEEIAEALEYSAIDCTMMSSLNKDVINQLYKEGEEINPDKIEKMSTHVVVMITELKDDIPRLKRAGLRRMIRLYDGVYSEIKKLFLSLGYECYKDFLDDDWPYKNTIEVIKASCLVAEHIRIPAMMHLENVIKSM